MASFVIGDDVRVVEGPAKGRHGVIRRTSRQSKGYRRPIFWVELARGEEHAFYDEELQWTGSHQVEAREVQPGSLATSCGGCGLPKRKCTCTDADCA